MVAGEFAATILQPVTDRPTLVAETAWHELEPTSATSSRLPTIEEGLAASRQQMFALLAQQWRREAGHLSSVTDIVLHPAYQRIIGMGRAALPLILAELAREPDHWFWALRAITGENPVTAEDAGSLPRMAGAWIRLGRERGWSE